MPANTAPIFTLTPNSIPAHIAAANTASDGSGTLVSLLTGATSGTRVDAVTFRNAQATAAASSAMVGRVFLSNESGVNFRIVGEVAIATATRSTTAIGATSSITFNPALMLKSGQVLSVCQSVYVGVADQNSAYTSAGDY